MPEGALSQMRGPIERVAVIRATRLGDYMCAVPTFRSLRAGLPDAEITLIALPLARELVRRSPYLDRFEEFPGFPGVRERSFDAAHTLAFLARQQRVRYDLAIQLHGSGVFSNPFTLMLGARYTAGFTRHEDDGFGLDFWVPYPGTGHEIHRVLLMARLLGTPDTGTSTDFPLLDEDHAAAREVARVNHIRLDQPLIGVHPGAKNPTRRWPPERFATVARSIARRLGATVLVTGAPGEEAECNAVVRALGGEAHNLIGQTDLGALAALMQRTRLFLTNDTGPAHVAYALGVPSVTIFGAAEPDVWGPLDSSHHKAIWAPASCRPCGFERCPVSYHCLADVSVQQVVEAAESLL